MHLSAWTWVTRGASSTRAGCWFPRQVPHAVANLTGKPCRFVTVVTPSGIKDFFRAQSNYIATLPTGVPPDPIGMAAVPGAGERRVLGPPLTQRAYPK